MHNQSSNRLNRKKCNAPIVPLPARFRALLQFHNLGRAPAPPANIFKPILHKKRDKNYPYGFFGEKEYQSNSLLG
jgi:hypothetical protein